MKYGIKNRVFTESPFLKRNLLNWSNILYIESDEVLNIYFLTLNNHGEPKKNINMRPRWCITDTFLLKRGEM